MARSSDENSDGKGSGWVKPVALAIGVAATAAWCGAEPAAKYLIGEPPEAPEAPEKPEPPKRVTAARGPMGVTVGFDITKSSIVHDLPIVTAATRDFFARTGVLRPNDRVDICTFAEDARCQSFTMPGDRSALDAAIAGIRPDPRPGSQMQTYVHRSVRQMVSQVAGEAIVLVWSDCIESEEGEKSPLPSDHPPVTLVVPQERYLPGAQSVDRSLGDSGVDVELARNSAEFGATLERFSGALDQRAQATAQAQADAEHRAKMHEYAAKMADYEAALANNDKIKAEFAAAKEAIEERIRAVKKAIRIGVGACIAGLLLLIGWDYRERNKPRLKGYIVDRRSKFPETYRLPISTEPKIFRALGGTPLTLEPTKEGLKCNGKLTRHGDQIMQGVFYYEKDPGIES